MHSILFNMHIKNKQCWSMTNPSANERSMSRRKIDGKRHFCQKTLNISWGTINEKKVNGCVFSQPYICYLIASHGTKVQKLRAKVSAELKKRINEIYQNKRNLYRKWKDGKTCAGDWIDSLLTFSVCLFFRFSSLFLCVSVRCSSHKDNRGVSRINSNANNAITNEWWSEGKNQHESKWMHRKRSKTQKNEEKMIMFREWIKLSD